MNKLFTLALVLLFSISIANAGLFSLAESNTANIDAVFPELIYNTNDCLTDCSAQFKYCIDSDSDYEMNFNIPEVTSYGYYATESETHKENTDKCLKEETLTYKCTEEELRNESGCKDYDYTVCNEWEQKDVTTESQVWHEGLPSEKAGCYEVTIYGKKNANENVDWQPTIVKKGFLWDTEYTQSLWAWWNTSWTKNRLISGLTGNITYMNLTYANYTGMNTTWQDMRFVAIDNTTALNYTIENYTTSGWATVRVNNLGASSIYIYYGNPTATTTSNANNTYFNPLAYYYLDENAGNVVDALYVSNGTANTGITYAQSGVVGVSANRSTSGKYTLPDINGSNSVNLSWSFWVYGTYDPYLDIYGKRAGTDNGQLLILGSSNGNNNFTAVIWNSGCSAKVEMISNYSWVNNTWKNIVYTYSNVTKQLILYVDGTYKWNGSVTNGMCLTRTDPAYIGVLGYGGITKTLKIDEVGLYVKLLTANEILALYNTTAPTITLGAETGQDSIWAFGTPLPANFTNISSNTINFNATPQGSFATLSCNLTINGTVNMTNSTVQNNTLTNFQAMGIADGYHNYTIDCWNGTTSNSTFVRYFTVDTTLPDVWFTSPTESAPASFISRTWARINATATDLHMANMTLEWDGTNLTFNTSTYTNATYQRGYSNLSGLADGEYYFRVFANDTFGNWNVSETRMVEVDTIAPTTTATAVGNTTGLPYTWSSTSMEGLNITLTCDDGAGSGCNVTQYCIDDFDVCVPNITYTGTISSVTSGTYYIRFFSNDTVNNTETTHSENFVIAVAGATPISYYLSYNDSGDTYTRSASASTNYGTLPNMVSATSSSNESFMWLNATDMFNAGHKIYATYLNYTVINTSGTMQMLYCQNTANYSAQTELTLTHNNKATICSSYSSLATFSTSGFKQEELSSIMNTTNLLGIIKYPGAVTSQKAYIYTKEYHVAVAQPKLFGLYAGNGNIFVNPPTDALNNSRVLKSSHTYSNITTSITYSGIGTSGYGTNNFSYISSSQITGLVTVTVQNDSSIYYPAKFYYNLYNNSAPLELYPILINKSSPNVNYVTFYVVDSIGNPIQSATINIYQNGNLTQQGYTDSSGAASLYLYSDGSYQVTASQGTTISSTYSITPTLSSYTIVLGIGLIELPSNIFDTINYVITPMTVTIPRATSTPISFYVWNSAGDSQYTRIYLYFTNGSLAGYTSSSSSHGANLTVNVNTNTTNTTRIDGFFEISRIDMGSYNITRNFVIKSYTNYTYSFINILNNFNNTPSISSDWKQIIAVCFSIGIAIFVFMYVGDVGSLLTGAVCFTIMGWMGWINFIIPLLIWLITIGYIFIRGGLF